MLKLTFPISITFVDTVETYFDSHVDLIQRKLQKHSDRLKLKAEETLETLKTKKNLSGDALVENLEREIKGLKIKVRRYKPTHLRREILSIV